MEWGTPVQWGKFLLFSRSGGHKTKESYPTRPGSPTPCKQGLREGSASKRQRREATPRDARNKGGSPRRKRDADDNLLNKFHNGIGDFLNFILAALELERDEVACTHNNTLQCAMTCSLGMYCM